MTIPVIKGYLGAGHPQLAASEGKGGAGWRGIPGRNDKVNALQDSYWEITSWRR